MNKLERNVVRKKAVKLDGAKLWEGIDCHTEGLDLVL